ncbi:MAG: hypothetical protein JJE39_04260 [Vicinamibacteria bacterium]|nr:hypothetical protein [Vicinamibacteria bacterium]
MDTFLVRRNLRTACAVIEVDEEIALHLDLRTRELVERGLDPLAAREQALRRMGDIRIVKRERCN